MFLPSTIWSTLSLASQSVFHLTSSKSLTPEPFTPTAFCYTGDPCFPNAEALAAFNESVDGLLFAEKPTGAVCYSDDLAYDVAGCKTALENMHSDQWLTNRFPS